MSRPFQTLIALATTEVDHGLTTNRVEKLIA